MSLGDELSDAQINNEGGLHIGRGTILKVGGAVAGGVLTALIIGMGLWYVAIERERAVADVQTDQLVTAIDSLSERIEKVPSRSDVEDAQTAAEKNAERYTDRRVNEVREVLIQQTGVLNRLDEDREKAEAQRTKLSDTMTELKVQLQLTK